MFKSFQYESASPCRPSSSGLFLFFGQSNFNLWKNSPDVGDFPPLLTCSCAISVFFLNQSQKNNSNRHQNLLSPQQNAYSFLLNNLVKILSCQSSIIFPLDSSASSTSTVWGRFSLGRSANASVDPKVQLPWKRQRRPRNGLGLVIFRRCLLDVWVLGSCHLSLHNLMFFRFTSGFDGTKTAYLADTHESFRQVVHWWAVWVPSHMLRSLLRCLTGPLGRKQLSSWLCRNSAGERQDNVGKTWNKRLVVVVLMVCPVGEIATPSRLRCRRTAWFGIDSVLTGCIHIVCC